jgi:hypothetical protein
LGFGFLVWKFSWENLFSLVFLNFKRFFGFLKFSQENLFSKLFGFESFSGKNN